jgi:hypothetical protein
MLQHAQMGNPSTASEQQGNEQEGQADGGVVGLRQSSMESIAQSPGQVEADQKQANEFQTAERRESLIFETECAWRVDATLQK